jgi:alpha-1,6-mannosyltransferase
MKGKVFAAQTQDSSLLDGHVRLHLDVLTAMTGASRFGQNNPTWRYSKVETHGQPQYAGLYTHLLTSSPSNHSADYNVVATEKGYERVEVDTVPPFLHVKTKDSVFLMKRKK